MQTKDLTLYTPATTVNPISSNICTLNLTAFQRPLYNDAIFSCLSDCKAPKAASPRLFLRPRLPLHLGQGLLPKTDHATYCVKLPVTLGVEAKSYSSPVVYAHDFISLTYRSLHFSLLRPHGNRIKTTFPNFPQSQRGLVTKWYVAASKNHL